MHVDSITTPFGRRSLTHAQLKHQAHAVQNKRTQSVDKWKVFRHISEARNHLGLQDRALAVLNALLSFFPAIELDRKQALIVFPSNTQLSLRAHGVCARTLRRSIAALVDAGIICRNDSPNGKRYAHRSRSGEIECAYGFDLSPLIARAEEFAELAAALAEKTMQLKRTKEAITICRRDLRKLIQLHSEGTNAPEVLAFSTNLDEILAGLTRNPSQQELDKVLHHLQSLRATLVNHMKVFEKSAVSSVNAGHADRHKEESESESHLESITRTEMTAASTDVADGSNLKERSKAKIRSDIPLDMVVRACNDILTCSPTGNITTWQCFIRAADLAREQLGVNREHYLECRRIIGDKHSAILIACLLQKQDRIRSSGAYFCQLSKMAKDNRFSPEKLLLSLLKQTYQSPVPLADPCRETIRISDRLKQVSQKWAPLGARSCI